jgi:thioredoxin
MLTTGDKNHGLFVLLPYLCCMKTFLAILSVFVLFCASCKSNASAGGRQDIDPARFSAVIDSLPDEQLVDVRTPEEFNGGHIKGAVNIDWNGSDFAGMTASLDKSKPVMVYCLSGGRSAQAADWFQKNGFKTVYQMQGGIRGWSAAGLPIEQGEAAPTANPTEITTAKYAALITSQDVVLCDFGAVWCGPCKMLAPRLEELKNDMPNAFLLVKLDADRDRHLADSMNVTALPTLFLYKKGKLVWRNEGLVDKSVVREAIEKKE